MANTAHDATGKEVRIGDLVTEDNSPWRTMEVTGIEFSQMTYWLYLKPLKRSRHEYYIAADRSHRLSDWEAKTLKETATPMQTRTG